MTGTVVPTRFLLGNFGRNLLNIQWVVQIRDSLFLEKMSQIREIWEFPYLPFLQNDVK